MRNLFCHFAVAVIVVIAPAVYGQHPSAGGGERLRLDTYRLSIGAAHVDKYVGDQCRGRYWSERFALDIGGNHQSLVSISASGSDLKSVNMSGITDNVRTLLVGVRIPFYSSFSVRVAYNSLIEAGSLEAVEALGVYSEYTFSSQTKMEVGAETFLDESPEIVYGFINHRPSASPLSSIGAGISEHRYEENGNGPFPYRRSIVGATWSGVPGDISIGCDPLSFDADRSAWMVAYARPVQYDDDRIWAPGMYLTWRQKPGSKYFLGMASFGGKSLNPDVCGILTRSGWKSLLIPTRVVRNQNFHIQTLSQHNQEFGRVSCSFVWFEFDVGDALASKSWEGSLYYSHVGWSAGRLAEPFIGYTASHEEQIVFNTTFYRLENPVHLVHAVELGFRLHILQSEKDSYERGYVRVAFSTLFSDGGMDGVKVYCTTWL
ncbi:MAG: hypothetical protein WC289_01655 [Patescibacteria group bacterium]|jgi:hypothetical protein